MLRLLFPVLLVCLSYVQTVAQSDTKIVELNLEDQLNDNMLSVFGKDGLMITTKVPVEKGNFDQLQFTILDTNLNQVAQRYARIDNKLDAIGYELNGNFKHHLFKRGKKMTLVNFDFADKKASVVKAEIPRKLEILNSEAVDKTLFIDGLLKKNRVLLAMNWTNGKYNVLPIQVRGLDAKNTYLESIYKSDDPGILLAAVTGKIKKNVRPFYLLKLNEKGKVKETITLTNRDKKNVLNARVVSQEKKGNYTVIGEYSDIYKKKKQNIFMKVVTWYFLWWYKLYELAVDPPNQRMEYDAEGIYFAQVTKKGVSKFNAYPFTKLKHFKDYETTAEQAHREKQLNRNRFRLNKNRKDAKSPVLTYAHEVYEFGDKLMYVGEIYEPTYYYITTTQAAGTTGATTTSTKRVFNGYKYSRAIFAMFDQKGKLLWDESMELELDYKPMTLKRHISVSNMVNNQITFSYGSGEAIFYQSIDSDGKITQPLHSKDLQLGVEGAKIKDSQVVSRPWYDDKFVIYGAQSQKDKTAKKRKDRNKTIYFIGKTSE